MDANTKSKILIVEDDEFLRSLTAKRLTKEGFEVGAAVDGETAVPTATEFKPDLILLDLLLPGVNGFEVLQQLQTNEALKKVPVIVFSNLGQKQDIEKATSLGAVDFLIKANFTLDDLILKINTRLGLGA
jgi:two-component system phosphate regulon response regulator PhoB/two-component system alkaline phosphatase synthesis response regulator PhoP